ncbi:hypothetical protein JHW43_008869 [Diplocarpon mali]|nr:hypothetical protein JHW43_008869 [Diplocarpon mali]
MSQSVKAVENAILAHPVEDELTLPIDVSGTLGTSAEDKLQFEQVGTEQKAPIVGIPGELQTLIFEPLLALQPGLAPPALLLALKHLPVHYAEAQSIYQTSNYVVNSKNQKEFVHLPMMIRMKVHHVVIDFTSSAGDEEDSDLINLRAALAFGSNNLLTITADFTHDDFVSDRSCSFTPRSQVAVYISYMAIASKPGVETIRAVYETKDPQLQKKYNHFLKELECSAGTIARATPPANHQPQRLQMDPTRLETIGELTVATWEKDSDVVKKFAFRPAQKGTRS